MSSGQPQAGGHQRVPRAVPRQPPAPPRRSPRPGAPPARGVARAPPRARDPARRRSARGARGDRRSDGAQRRRQVHAAAPRRRAAGAHPRARSSGPGGSRCCCRTPATTSSTTAWTARSPRARSRRRAWRAWWPQPPRPLRRGAPAPGARDRHRRGARSRRCSRSTSPPAGWTASRRRGSQRSCAAAPRAARRWSSPPTTPSSPARAPVRTVLLADGRVIADGPAAELLAGGWYFATETARILGGAGGALRAGGGRGGCSPPRWCGPQVLRLRGRASAPADRASATAAGVRVGEAGAMSWPLATFLARRPRAARRLACLRARPALRADGGRRRQPWPPWRRSAATPSWRCPKSSRSPRSCSSSATSSGRCPVSPWAPIGMLASNVMLGQGPYTPWQMAAWGLVGRGGRRPGAAHRQAPRAPAPGARLRPRRTRRHGGHERVHVDPRRHPHPRGVPPDRRGTALSFNLVDVAPASCFGLAFAPELARVLTRMRARMDVRWEAAGAGAPTLAETGTLRRTGDASRRRVSPRFGQRRVSPGFGRGRARSRRRAAAGRGSARAGVLRPPVGAPRRLSRRSSLPRASSRPCPSPRRSPPPRARTSPPSSPTSPPRRTPTGGGAPRAGQPPSELYSAWAAMGLAAAGRPPQSVRRDGHTVLEALRALAGTLEGPGDLERTMLALHACGAPVTSLAGKNLLAGLLHYRAADGSFAHQVNLTAFAVFALRAAGHSAADPRCVPRARGSPASRTPTAVSTSPFAGVPATWTTPPPPCRVSSTRASAAARASRARSRSSCTPRTPTAVSPSSREANRTPSPPRGPSRASSRPASNVEAVRHRGSRSPLGYLESLVAPNGSVRYSRTSAQTPVWVTAQALTALARAPFPIG